MTTFDLRSLRLRPGAQQRARVPVVLAGLELGGQRYDPDPPEPEAALAVTRLASGVVLELSLDATLRGPCFRCLEPAAVGVRVRDRQYQATRPESDEQHSPYVEDDLVDLSAWAHDAVALELPEKILCREDCAGLCGSCGANLNEGACTCAPPEPDTRWAKLAELRDRLG